MPEKLSLGGKVYRPAGIGPVKHDLYLMMHARHCGLAGASIREDEAPEDFASRLLDAMITSGRALLILGALLIPDGKTVDDWTEEMAYETAGALGAITDPAEKKLLYQELLSALLGFFQHGLGSWVASPRSSGAGAASTETTRKPARDADPSATGPTSSGGSASETPTGAEPSSAGT